MSVKNSKKAAMFFSIVSSIAIICASTVNIADAVCGFKRFQTSGLCVWLETRHFESTVDRSGSDGDSAEKTTFPKPAKGEWEKVTVVDLVRHLIS